MKMKYVIELTEKELDVIIMGIETGQRDSEIFTNKEWDLLWDTKEKLVDAYQQNPIHNKKEK